MMTHQPVVHGDPGLQPERTALAWERTTLSLAVICLLFLRWTDTLGVIAFAPTVLALVVAAHLRLRHRQRARRAAAAIASERGVADVSSALTLTVAVVATALLGIAIIGVHA